MSIHLGCLYSHLATVLDVTALCIVCFFTSDVYCLLFVCPESLLGISLVDLDMMGRRNSVWSSLV